MTLLTPFLLVNVFFLAVTTTVQAHIHFDEDHHHDHHELEHGKHNHYHRYHRGLRDIQRMEESGGGLFQKFLFNQSVNGLDDHTRCASRDPTSEEMIQSATVVQKWMSNTAFRQERQGLLINVSTYFHVIYANDADFSGPQMTVGVISDDDLQKQLSVLNDSFRPYGFSFTLLGTTRTENYDWYYASFFSDEDFDMRISLRVGDASSLNVYFNAASNFAGYATLPMDYIEYPQFDGVAVLSTTIPGGAHPSYNEGKTLVHEVGHWLGLQHTFHTEYKSLPFWFTFANRFLRRLEPECYYKDDGVDDTPRQATLTRGCPERKDTCPYRRGLDPIHNYMDYSDDVCYTEFTTGQMNRMQAMWYEYRA